MDSLSERSAPDVARRKQRLNWSISEKRRIVEATLVDGASVALVAREHGVNANLLFRWRRLYQAGRLAKRTSKAIQTAPARLLPVTVSVDAPAPGLPATNERVRTASVHAPAGIIHIQFAKAQVRLEGGVDPAVLRVVLEALSR